MYYFDSAATSLYKPNEVVDAVAFAMKHQGNAGRGVNAASLSSGRMIYETREMLAKLFNVEKPTQIAFTYNSTESLNIAIKGLFKKGDHIITTVCEHNSVLRPLYEMMNEGVEVSFVNVDKNGMFLYDEFLSNIKSNTKAIICMHASNLTGNLFDIERVGKIANENKLLFIVDASQTAGVFDIDVKKQNIDVLCFTGHKSLLGPQGTGGIYVREGLDIRSLKSGGSGVQTYSKTHPIEMPTRLEAGTLNSHGIAGLNASLKWIENIGMENIRQKENELMMHFAWGIKDIKGIKIYGDFTLKERAPIVSINISDISSTEVGDYLSDKYDICVRSGSHCAPLMHEAFGTKEQGQVRFSFSYFNTLEEVDYAIKALKEITS